MTSDAALLIHLKLKGFVRPALMPGDPAALIAAGLVEAAKLGLKLTDAGKAAAALAWAAERDGADTAVLDRVYTAFDPVNAAFKQLVGRWQLRGGAPNDHTDAAYDAGVFADLADIDAAVQPLIADAANHVPRLARYADGLSVARTQIAAGQTRWFAAPIIDSYHTLWFELHEELIQLTGRTRAAEAAAGRAA